MTGVGYLRSFSLGHDNWITRYELFLKYKTAKLQRHSAYRGSKLWNEIPKDLLNRPYHTFTTYVNSSSFKYKLN